MSIGDHFEAFINGRISSGRYKNASEVVRAGLRLLEEEENRIAALKNAIEEGVESGLAVDYTPASHLASLKAKHSLNETGDPYQ